MVRCEDSGGRGKFCQAIDLAGAKREGGELNLEKTTGGTPLACFAAAWAYVCKCETREPDMGPRVRGFKRC